MKLFIYKCLFFLVFLSLAFSALFFIPLQNVKMKWEAGMIDKHNRLNEIKKPKIILAGGSNVSFGVDSKMIQEKFKIPVVNLSIQHAYGISYLLEELKHSIDSLDIVLISFEYFLRSKGNYQLELMTSNIYPESKQYYKSQILSNISIYLDVLQNSLIDEVKYLIKGGLYHQGIYSRASFNKYGDMISHLNKSTEDKEQLNFSYRYWEGINLLNEFNKYAKFKGVNVFYLYPTIAISQYTEHLTSIDSLEADLAKELSIEIIGKPTSFVFADSLYFDTFYHLTKEGKKNRTKELISLLSKNSNAQEYINAIKK